MSGGADGGKTVAAKVLAVLESELYSLVLDNGDKVTAHVGEPLRLYNVRLLEGDRVRVALSPFDPSRGRIVERVR